MTTRDLHGHPLSGASAAARDHFETALQRMRCLIDDPMASVQAAIAESPRMTMAHALTAWLYLTGTDIAGIEPARAALAAARECDADDRESMHLAAIAHLADGRFRDAAAQLEDLSIRYPRDTIALQVGHYLDFFLGDSRMLRDRIARAVGHWSDGMPGHHAVLGMYAFGLEECGQYARAEAVGRRAVEIEPRDGWAWHAVAHVMEMQNRRRDGIAWLGGKPEVWSEGSFFQIHNWWHLALFHLGLDDIDRVMELVDTRVLASASPVVLDMIDASAMLWRLQLRGIEVGSRWHSLADRWMPHAEAGLYAFNDAHAMMALVGADRMADAAKVLAAQQRALAAGGDNAYFLAEVGHDLTRAIYAFGIGRHGDAVALLRPLRSRSYRFGGSHAQRDLIDLTLIEAARRDGQRLLADALAGERAERLQ